MARAPQVEKKARASCTAEAAADPLVIPLDLAPLLAPYKRQGRLSLRVERLPQLARLSAGHKNGDGSWSLNTDELEDLKYFVPEGAEGEHALAIRIVSLAGGQTLALVDHLVSASGASAAASGEGDATPAQPAPAKTPVNGVAKDESVNLLLGELAKMKATLAAHESQLAETRQKAEQVEAKVSDQTVEAALAAARAAWESELTARIAEADARAKAELQAARTAWQQEMQAAQGKALETWKAEEAARASAAETAWKAATAKAVAEARAQAAAARDPSAEAAVAALRQQLVALEARLAERDAALTRAEAAAREAQERSQGAVQETLSKAEQAWKAGEAERLAAAEARWQAASAKALAEARAASATRDQSADSERGRLSEELAALKAQLAARETASTEFEKSAAAMKAALTAREAALAEAEKSAASLKATLAAREAALAEVEKSVSALRDRAPQETQQALAHAEQAWKAAEAQRLAAAEAAWRAAQEKAIAAALAEAQAACAEAQAVRGEDQVEFRALHERLAQLQTTLSEREAALARAEKTLAQAAEREQRELHSALSKASKTQKTDEAARLAAAQAEWRKQSAATLNQAIGRAEAAEAALAQIRVKGTPKTDPRTESELNAMRAALATREEELAHLRATLERYHLSETGQDHAQPAPGAERAAPDNRRFTRDVVIAAVVGAVAVLGYPVVESLIAPSAPPAPPPAVAEVAPKPPAPPPAPAPLRLAQTVKDANVRAEPAKDAAVVAKIPRGVEVAVMEERGNWLRVRAEATAGQSAGEGWVHATLVKDATPRAQTKPEKAVR
jgi:hypothetical protein